MNRNMYNQAIDRVANRLRINYSSADSIPYIGKIKDEYIKDNSIIDPSIIGMKIQTARFNANGGNAQQDRMIYDKRRTLDRALLYSYQAANVQKIDCDKPFRALINSDKLKQDYDDKIVSAPYENNLHPGDVFQWLGTNTYWIVYLQELTELAYFRGDIRRCSYEIAWEDENDEIHRTYAAIRGPVETKINYIQKHQISVDTPNHSLHILMPKNEDTLKYFQRYSKFYLQDNSPGAPKICWRVEATDWISMPGILELNAVEYYANEIEDDIENGIVGGLVLNEIENPNNNNIENSIVGETFIKPKVTYKYKANVIYNANWVIDKKYPIKIEIDEKNPKIITLKWTSSYSGSFELKYGNLVKTIVVQSLF